MKAPKEIHKIWKKEITPSDVLKIAETYHINKRTVQRARETGRCLQTTMDAVNHYLMIKRYNEKEFIKQFKEQ